MYVFAFANKGRGRYETLSDRFVQGIWVRFLLSAEAVAGTGLKLVIHSEIVRHASRLEPKEALRP
jgi:hypothetical protein